MTKPLFGVFYSSVYFKVRASESQTKPYPVDRLGSLNTKRKRRTVYSLKQKNHTSQPINYQEEYL